MATMTDAAMRLEDWAKLSKSEITQGLTVSLYATDSILKDVPFKNDPSLKATGVRITPNGLPNPTYGAINETPQAVRTTTEQHQESAYLIRENVKIDKRFVSMKGLLTNPIEVQMKGLLEAWARRLNTDAVQNDPLSPTGNKLAPIGWLPRMLNPTKYGHVAECAINCAGVNMSATMTKSSAIAFFVFLDQALDYMNASDGSGVVLYMSDFMFRAISMAGKIMDNGSGLSVTKDNYDHQIMTYQGAKLRKIGRQLDDVTRIISYTETTDGTQQVGGNCTSIYGIKYGSTDVLGWHDGAFDLEKVGMDTSGIFHVFLMDYLFGFYHSHTRTLTRLSGIKIQ